MTNIISLKDTSEIEAYKYFDKNIRDLPKNPNGEINRFGPGLVDNDVDAFRHAYASGRYTQYFGENTADILGYLWELTGNNSAGNGSDKNMDLWNNFIGRKYGKIASTKEALLKLLHKALNAGELIIDFNDLRVYKGKTSFNIDPQKPIIVLEERNTGRNETFLDLLTGAIMNRDAFVNQIRAGIYPGYTIANINNLATPMSKLDGSINNNLG